MRTYTKDNKTYVSVTEIIGMMYPFDEKGFASWARWKGLNSDWISAESRRIGTKVHQWVENRFHGIESWADNSPIDEKESNYLKAVQVFLGSVDITDCEQTVYNDEFGYAGTYDLIADGTLYDVKTWGSWKGEYKYSADKMKKVAIQSDMYREAHGGGLKTAVCILLPEGDFIVEELKPNDSWKKWIEENKNKLLV